MLAVCPGGPKSRHESVCARPGVFASLLWDRELEGRNALCGIGLVVHEEELNVLDVADEEGLMAGGHHVLGLLVGAIADLELQFHVSHLVPFSFDARINYGPSQQPTLSAPSRRQM